jgi:hydroxyacylglutathione hydrolase
MKVTQDLYAFIWSNPTANNCNTYLIDGEKRILVDPGHYHLFSHVRENLAGLDLAVQDMDLILITHGHPDHVEGIRSFLDSSALVAISRIELDFLKEIAPQYGESLGSSGSGFDFFLQEGDLRVGNRTFQVIHTPGHSPGSVCLYWPDRKALFTGDVIFYQGIGRTDLPSGDGGQLKESIKRISSLDVEYLLPGHGNMISGRENVEANFEDIERMWFGYL